MTAGPSTKGLLEEFRPQRQVLDHLSGLQEKASSYHSTAACCSLALIVENLLAPGLRSPTQGQLFGSLSSQEPPFLLRLLYSVVFMKYGEGTRASGI